MQTRKVCVHPHARPSETALMLPEIFNHQDQLAKDAP